MQLGNEIITPEMSEIRSMIVNTVVQRNQLKDEMEKWYQEYPNKHFPRMNELSLTDSTLSQLDSSYKQLWDYNNTQSNA